MKVSKTLKSEYAYFRIYKMYYLGIPESIYIGITKNSLVARLLQHLRKPLEVGKVESKRDKFIADHPEIHNYRIESLSEGYMTREEAEMLEEDYITKYNSIECGLNTSLGGTFSRYSYHFKKQIRDYYLDGMSLYDISEITGLSVQSVYGILYKFCKIEHVKYKGLVAPPYTIDPKAYLVQPQYVIDPRFYIPNAPPYTFRDI